MFILANSFNKNDMLYIDCDRVLPLEGKRYILISGNHRFQYQRISQLDVPLFQHEGIVEHGINKLNINSYNDRFAQILKAQV